MLENRTSGQQVTYWFGDDVRFLRVVVGDEIIIPVPVYPDACLGNNQGPRFNV